MNSVIAVQRLENQGIASPRFRNPADVVASLGAVQAQEYQAAKWALALRIAGGTTDAKVERALNEGRILRTHVMRPTWHFVTPSDIRWMLELTADRIARALRYANRVYGIDSALQRRAARIFERAVRDGHSLTRAELGTGLARAGIAAKGIHLALLTVHAEINGILCSGPRRGRQFTYALVAERAPRARSMPRDEALAELTRRYFTSHGPATIRDFAWWSGLASADARRGLAITRARQHAIDGRTYWTLGRSRARDMRQCDGVHLLPIYDEYFVAYRDRDPVPASRADRGGLLRYSVVIAGQRAGTWRPIATPGGVTIEVRADRRLTRAERSRVADAADRYAGFAGIPTSTSIIDTMR